MICTTYFLTFFSELIPPTGYIYSDFSDADDADSFYRNTETSGFF